MPKQHDNAISIRLATVLQRKLQELKTNPRRLSQRLGYAYDTVRKVYNGQVFPGDELLTRLCKELHLNFDEMKELVATDRMIDKGWGQNLLDQDKMLNNLRVYWDQLSDMDKQDLVDLAKAKSSRPARSAPRHR